MSFAYLHECFPDPTKTFVYREVLGMSELGLRPAVFSIRRPTSEEAAHLEEIPVQVRYLPSEGCLREIIENTRRSFSLRQRRALSHWREQKGDSTRVFEALWLGRELRALGIRHVHAHFAGLAARTAWLVREIWGIGYSFTGHADDIFTPEEKPISLEMLVRNARFIATETDYSRRRLEEEYPAARGKTHRVFNGIVPAAFSAAQAEPDKRQPPRILSIGRLVEKKGFPHLLQACAILRDGGLAFGCDILGAGPLEEPLRAQLRELELEDVVTLHGAQPQPTVRQFLASARVFALAAQREGDGGSDNLPTVIMEAMCAGLPVVSTRVAGIPEMVEDGATGTLVAPEDPVALADAARKYLENGELSARHGAAGRERAGKMFAVDRSAVQLAELLVRHGAVQAGPEVETRHPQLARSFAQRLLDRLGLRG